jgi:head-tail adaptor
MARAGSYRHFGIFERAAADAPKDRWAQVHRTRLNLRVTPGKERIAAGQQEAPVLATIRMRDHGAASQLTARDRVLIGGAIWILLSDPTDPQGRGREVEVLAQRGGGKI